MDLHVSVIADFKTACPDVDVVDWCLSGHAWVLGRKQDCPLHINPHTWQDLTPERIRAFQEEYHWFLSQFDGFIVGYCSAFAMIYEKYKKPILMLNAVRYDIPFCFTKDVAMRQSYHECLQRLHDRNLLTIVSNNRADQEYTRLGCGIQPEYRPSLCLYTKMKYTPTKSTFFCYNWSCTDPLPDHPLITKRQGVFSWQDLETYKGVIVFPYEISLMSMFEHFTAGLPMFLPSKEYMRRSHQLISNSSYWAHLLPAELSSCTTEFWIEHSDRFASPNTFYFDSVPHLLELLSSFQYTDDRSERQSYIHSIQDEWAAWLTRIFQSNPK